jgi:5,10-methylenetetrahydromethanopterin reductase
LTGSNGWDQSVLTQLRSHGQLVGTNADQGFHRAQLMEPAKLVPDEWMAESCAIGDVATCVERLREYRDAGADEIAIYASTPLENEGLIAAWRELTDRRPARAGNDTAVV